MDQIIIPKPMQVKIVDRPVPEPVEDDQMLVRTEYSGVSLGTEKIFYDGTWEKDPSKYPIEPGYVAVGIIEKCGSKVTRFKSGERVVTMGVHAEYVRVREAGAYRVPEHVKPEKATLSVLGATATHGIKRGRIPYRGTVAIFGAGVLGCLLLQHAKSSGAGFVMVCDLNDGKLAVAGKLGADLTVNAAIDSPSEKLLSAAGGYADVSYEVAGGGPAAMEEALLATRERGRVFMMGGGDRGIVHFPYRALFARELSVEASRAIGGIENFRESVESIISGRINVDPFPTEIRPYTEIEGIYNSLVNGDYDFMHMVLKWK